MPANSFFWVMPMQNANVTITSPPTAFFWIVALVAIIGAAIGVIQNWHCFGFDLTDIVMHLIGWSSIAVLIILLGCLFASLG